MNRRNMILGAFAVLGLGGWALTSKLRPNSTPVNPLASAANAQTTDVDTSAVKEMMIGNPDAPVTIIEYASFTCPHCAAFHKGAFKELKAEYIDTGKINFIYREVYFDRFGLWASIVARCGGAEKFFGISDLIYKGQAEWTRAGEPAAIADELGKIGRLAGIDGDTLDACFKDAETAEALVAWEAKNREADAIQSTPSFLINGKLHSNMSYADMKDLIDAAIAG